MLSVEEGKTVLLYLLTSSVVVLSTKDTQQEYKQAYSQVHHYVRELSRDMSESHECPSSLAISTIISNSKGHGGGQGQRRPGNQGKR